MGNRLMGTAIAVAVVSAFSSVLLAQSGSGLNAVPRTSDGKPDLSGVWLAETPFKRAMRLGKSLVEPEEPSGGGRGARPFQPWAQKMFEYQKDPFRPNRPRNELNPRSTRCFPPDVEYLITNDNDHVEIIQSPKRVLMIYEYDFWMRQAWMNEDHPDAEELDLTWMGHSVGKWDGDTLVIDTIRMDPGNSYGGFIHTDALHLVERIQRVKYDMLEINVTVNDPKAYTESWTFGPVTYVLEPDWRLEERVFCNDRFHKEGIWYGE